MNGKARSSIILAQAAHSSPVGPRGKLVGETLRQARDKPYNLPPLVRDILPPESNVEYRGRPAPNYQRLRPNLHPLELRDCLTVPFPPPRGKQSDPELVV